MSTPPPPAVALAAPTPVAAGQAAASKAATGGLLPEVGDRWTYRFSDGYGKTENYTIRITAVTAEGIRARVVSMPSLELFEAQSQEYRDSVLPPAVRARVAVEQASTLGWHRYVGLDGAVIGMETFGASAPLKELLTKFGFTPDRVVETAKQVLGR